MAKELHFANSARSKLFKGIEQLTDAVKVTMGPKGRNVLLGNINGVPHITKDGVSVAKSINLKDNVNDIGAQLMITAAEKVVDEVGDGTTTVTVLTYELLKEGNRLIASGASPINIKRGMEKGLMALVNELKRVSRPVTTYNEIKQVATLSANSDEAIGKIIADAIDSVGDDGIVRVETSSGLEDSLDVVNGMEIDKGYLSKHFDSNKKGVIEMNKPLIVIINTKINVIDDVMDILVYAKSQSKSLVMIVNEIGDKALKALIMNKVQGVVDIVVIESSGYGYRKYDTLEDLSLTVGAKLIDEKTGVLLSDFKVDVLGSADKVVITKDKTTIVNGYSNQIDIESQVLKIKTLIDKSTSDLDKRKLKERIAKLTAGVATIYIGGNTETEMLERKDRADDAISAAKSAIAEGIVIGGGCALIKIIDKIQCDLNGEELMGFNILKKVVEKPLIQIATNAGYADHLVIRELKTIDFDVGFDAKSGTFINMFDKGIINSTKVERVTIETAVSMATLLMMVDVLVVKKKR